MNIETMQMVIKAEPLVKSPHWKWLKGMQYRGKEWSNPEGWGSSAYGIDYNTPHRYEYGTPTKQAVPDLDDPMTIQGIFLVAREAWKKSGLRLEIRFCANTRRYRIHTMTSDGGLSSHHTGVEQHSEGLFGVNLFELEVDAIIKALILAPVV